MSFETGFFGFFTRRVGPLDAAAFATLQCTQVKCTGSRFAGNFKETATPLDPSVMKALVGVELPQAICPELARLERNENAADVLVFTFDATSHNGLVFVEGSGIYEVYGGEYPWREMQNLDLVFSLDENEHLAMWPLK